MLYSARHSFIYLKTVKTGGTSVEVALEPLCAPPGHVPQHATGEIVSDHGIIGARGQTGETRPVWYNHMPAVAVREGLGADVFDSCRRVACLRNPFDKAVSAFWFGLRDAVPDEECARIDAFRTGLRQTYADPKAMRETTGDWRACHLQGRCILTDTISYEALEADTQAFVQSLGLPPLVGAFPRLKTQHRAPDALPVSAYYDKASADLVRTVFDWMFEAGDYAMDPAQADRICAQATTAAGQSQPTIGSA